MTSGGTTGIATWRDPRWRTEALEWAAGQLARWGLEPAGEPEQPHVRTWSTGFPLPLRGGGAAWLKSVGLGSAQEPVLARALGGWAPGHVLVPLAVEPARRLLLLPDGGTTLRETGGDPAAWEDVLQAYAGLQLALVPHADALLALGVPDTRPERLPDLVDDLLADDGAQLIGRPRGLDPDVRRQLTARRDDVAKACRRRPGPFLSLLVALRMAAGALGLRPGDPALGRLRDAYLEPWTAYGTPGQLRGQCDLALKVAPLERALTWRRIPRGVHPDERGEWADSVPGWTAEDFEPGPLAGVPA